MRFFYLISLTFIVLTSNAQKGHMYITNYDVDVINNTQNTNTYELSRCDDCSNIIIYFVRNISWDNGTKTLTFEESSNGIIFNTVTLSKCVDRTDTVYGINDSGSVLYWFDLFKNEPDPKPPPIII